MQPIVKYNITDAAISTMESEYLPLTIAGVSDTVGLATVHAARMEVKNTRVEVEKRRKELKADAIAWGKAVDTEANRIKAKLQPIEDHLKAEEDRVKAEKDRIKRERERREQERVQARVDAFLALEVHIPFAEAAELTEEEYLSKLDEAKSEFEAEQARREEEEQRRKEKEAEDQKRFKEERARLAAEQKRLDDERKVLEAERQRLREATPEPPTEPEAVDTLPESDANMTAHWGTDTHRLNAYADSLLDVRKPELDSDEARAVLTAAEKKLKTLTRYIIKQAAALTAAP